MKDQGVTCYSHSALVKRPRTIAPINPRMIFLRIFRSIWQVDAQNYTRMAQLGITKILTCGLLVRWSQGKDLNLRPLGYEAVRGNVLTPWFSVWFLALIN